MIKENKRFQSSTVFEGMTSLRAVIAGREAGIHDRPIYKVLYAKENMDKNAKNIGYLRAVSSKHGFELEETTRAELDRIALGSTHGGIIALCGERLIPLLCDHQASLSKNGFYAMIQGIEDPYNFGYALRSLYAVGCTGILLTERNWMSAAGVVARSSAGASERFTIYRAEPIEAVELFGRLGYMRVCADEHTEHVLGECALPLPLLLIVGGEKRGISKALLERTDLRVKIAYGRSFHASLSAASATTMFAYEILRQNKSILSEK